MAKLVMGYWDCPVCGNKGIRGDVVNCPSCGRARGDVQFYMKDYTEGEILEENERGDMEYLDEEKAASFSKNPDWYCSFCNSLNSDNAKSCSNCGASREDSEANYFQMLQKKKEKEAAEAAAQSSGQDAKPNRKPLLILLAVAAVIVLLFVWLNGSKTNALKVTALEWVRNVNVEENRQFSESGWTLPSGAELTGTRNEIHHYDQVLDRYENKQEKRTREVIDHYKNVYEYKDNGNGTFSEVSRQEPVYKTETYYETVRVPVYRSVPRYATKYYYNIWRWTPSRDVTASGDTHEAYWPEVTLGENEREGEKTEAYRFTVQNPEKPGDVSTWRIAENDWRNIEVGSDVYITSKRTGSNPVLSDKDGNPIADIRREK